MNVALSDQTLMQVVPDQPVPIVDRHRHMRARALPGVQSGTPAPEGDVRRLDEQLCGRKVRSDSAATIEHRQETDL